MRLGIYTPNYPGISGEGGIGSYTRTLAETLTALGHTVHVLTVGTGETRIIQNVAVHQVDLRHFPLVDRFWPGFGYCWYLAQKLRRMVREYQLELVELPNWEGLGIFYQQSRLTPTVVRLHTSSWETQQIDQLPATRLLQADVSRELQQARQADLLLTHSFAHRQRMAEELNCSCESITVIPHGVKVYPEYRRPPREPGPLKLLFLSRLEKRKGVQELLLAFPAILEKHPGAVLTLIGHDREHAPAGENATGRTFAQWFSEEFPKSLQAHVHFLGWQPEEVIRHHLQTSDIFIVPSRYESFGLIYPEAMRWGIPVIGCRVGGVPELIRDGETGILIDPQSPDQIFQAVDRLLANDELRFRMGEAGKLHVERNFSAENMAGQVSNCYTRLLRQTDQFAG
ncbi:MAG TPA: glycosyltransferase family 4 protein [Gemmatales bacterium]|nr:glycosyltransferase family 4 protein [Gemmatales bacterium]HMP15882.1 glycosyltransferase family 4 protein [Gemmatales bacterium]